VTESSGSLPDVAISVGAVAVARRAHELGLALTPEQCEDLARAVLDAAVQYLDGAGPDAESWPPLPDPES
jgi:hypothetical protein